MSAEKEQAIPINTGRLPKIGEMVLVRSRRWLVEEVVEPKIAGHSPVIRLACADDDAQGQALEVFWNFEIDRQIFEAEGWKDLAAKGFDEPRHHRLPIERKAEA